MKFNVAVVLFYVVTIACCFASSLATGSDGERNASPTVKYESTTETSSASITQLAGAGNTIATEEKKIMDSSVASIPPITPAVAVENSAVAVSGKPSNTSIPTSTTATRNATTITPATTINVTTPSISTVSTTSKSESTTQSATSNHPRTNATSPTPFSETSTQSIPAKDRRFDGPSFIGGIVLSLGTMAIGFVAFKFYKARTERNYHTL